MYLYCLYGRIFIFFVSSNLYRVIKSYVDGINYKYDIVKKVSIF